MHKNISCTWMVSHLYVFGYVASISDLRKNFYHTDHIWNFCGYCHDEPYVEGDLNEREMIDHKCCTPHFFLLYAEPCVSSAVLLFSQKHSKFDMWNYVGPGERTVGADEGSLEIRRTHHINHKGHPFFFLHGCDSGDLSNYILKGI